MYIAKDSFENLVNSIEENIDLSVDYFCPLCKQKVIYKKGIKIQSHFAHVKNSNCNFNTYKTESKEHLEVKGELYKRFKLLYDVNLEHIFKVDDSLQIADVYLKEINLAFEYQRSIIPYFELLKRTLGYKKANINLIWLIDINKFIKELNVCNNIIYLRYAPFVDNFLNYHKGAIFFYGYDRLKKEIVFYQLWSWNLNKRNAICKKVSYKLDDLRIPIKFKFFKNDLTAKLYPEEIKNYIYTQLKYDKTVKNKILSSLYNKRISTDNIPKEIGVNINEQILLETPLILWQLEVYKLYNDGKSYGEIVCQMLNFIKVKNSIYLNLKTKNEIIQNVVKKYYVFLCK